MLNRFSPTERALLLAHARTCRLSVEDAEALCDALGGVPTARDSESMAQTAARVRRDRERKQRKGSNTSASLVSSQSRTKIARVSSEDAHASVTKTSALGER
mgnify:CR=1 FL=1